MTINHQIAQTTVLLLKVCFRYNNLFIGVWKEDNLFYNIEYDSATKESRDFAWNTKYDK